MGWCNSAFALHQRGDAGRDELIAYLERWSAGHSNSRRYVKVGFDGQDRFIIRFKSESDRNHAKLGW